MKRITFHLEIVPEIKETPGFSTGMLFCVTPLQNQGVQSTSQASNYCRETCIVSFQIISKA